MEFKVITRRMSMLLLAGTLSEAIRARVASVSMYGKSVSRPDDRLRYDLGMRLDEAVKTGKLENLHAVVVVQGDNVVLERYYEGPDQFWGMPIGSVTFGPGVKHDLRSASKSVVGLLYGIALNDGKAPGLDSVLIDQFPDLRDLASDAKRRSMKVRHALTMTMGMEWPEDKVSYADSRNAEIAMYLATNQFRYVFDHPMIAEPGTQWIYCGGATAILGHLIAQGTKVPLFEYARRRLFEPLGIVEVQWVGGIDGEVAAASGLRMCPRDFAKLGQLVLNRGRWGNKQVVPQSWLDDAITPRVRVDQETEYGYQWYIANGSGEDRAIAARGNGGQYLTVIPSLNLVVAIMAGGYNKGGGVSATALSDYVLPALE